MDISSEKRSDLLTVALREHFSEREANNKAKKALARVWLNPPPEAAAMITWALRNPQEFPDRRLMHAGALIATFPFVGGLLAMVGRQHSIDEVVTIVDLRRRAQDRWGATSTVREGVSKAITTLRRLDVVEGGGRSPIEPTSLSSSAMASSWLVHAIMLTRGVQSIDTHDALHAPELCWVDGLKPTQVYPFLDVHTEGTNRRVWATN